MTASVTPAPLGTGHIHRAGAGILLILVLLHVFGSSALRPLQLAWFDALQAVSPRKIAALPAVVVQIDEKSLAEIGQWPWPRSVLARLIDAIARLDAAAIGIDILMPEPDRLSPSALANLIPADDETRARLRALPDNDAVLAAALRRAPVVLGVAGVPEVSTTRVRAPPVLMRGRDPDPRLRQFAGVTSSLELIDTAAPGHGLLSADLEGGVVRRVPLIARVADTVVPGFTLEILRVASGAPNIIVSADGASVSSVGVADLTIPTDADGAVWVHFAPRNGRPRVSAVDVLAGRVDPDLLRRKLVLIGATGLGLLDYQTAATGERMPGIEVHAQVLESVFDEALLLRPIWLRWTEAAMLLLLGTGLTIAVPVLSPRRSVPLIVGALAGLWALSFGMFRYAHLLLDAAAPGLGIMLLFGALLALTLAAATRRERLLELEVQRQREDAARVAGELEAARRIQTGILPRPETMNTDVRIEIAAEMTPAREVGGDLYDFFALDGDRMFFIVGDVSGKGLSASIFMAVSKALYKSCALRGGNAADDLALVGELMTQANAEVSRENSEAMFVTAFAGILDLESGVLAYCNAGHDDPYVLGGSGVLARLGGGDGPPLCVIDDFEYAGNSVTLAAGDMLCVVTDGVTEAQDATQALYGGERFRQVLEAARRDHARAAGLLAQVHADVARFVDGAEPADDLTILVLRWNGGAGRPESAPSVPAPQAASAR